MQFTAFLLEKLSNIRSNRALPRTVGTGTAMDLLLSARKFKGDEAKEMGIVQKVFPKETLVS